MYFISTFLCLLLVGLSFGSVCVKPTVNAVSYTTQDATVITNIAFIIEFTFKCSNGFSGLPLYAEVNGNVFPAVHVEKEKYQVSWTDEIGKSRSGDYEVNLYDEEGYAALRKALRNPEQSQPVQPLGTVVLNHPGAYQGPWVNSEFMAAFVAGLVWYLAFSAKSKLLL